MLQQTTYSSDWHDDKYASTSLILKFIIQKQNLVQSENSVIFLPNQKLKTLHLCHLSQCYTIMRVLDFPPSVVRLWVDFKQVVGVRRKVKVTLMVTTSVKTQMTFGTNSFCTVFNQIKFSLGKKYYLVLRQKETKSVCWRGSKWISTWILKFR